MFFDDVREIGYLDDLIPDSREKANIGAAFGTGFHSGAELALNDKKQGTSMVKPSDSEEMSISSFRSECRDGVSWDDITPNANTAEKQLRQVSKTFWNMFLPKMDPLEVEISMKAATKDYTLTGHADFVEADSIHDLKSGRHRLYHAQVGAYSILSKSNDIVRPEKLIIDWIPRAMTKNPKIRPQSFEYDVAIAESEARAVLSTILSQYKHFQDTKDKRAFPCNPNSMLCSPKWCKGYGTDWCPVTK